VKGSSAVAETLLLPFLLLLLQLLLLLLLLWSACLVETRMFSGQSAEVTDTMPAMQAKPGGPYRDTLTKRK
jgi:hypothetical protein